MSFSDDDEIVLPPDSGPKPIVPGRVQLEIRNNDKAPLEENIQKVMLELTGEKKSRSGLDLVAVLDVSGSMKGDKLAKLKIAMIFVMKKLTLVDRLSIVKYSTEAKRLCPLHQMTESSHTELENLIKDLKAGGNTNITDGLLTALKVLENRSVTNGRVGVIMLMSDGEENRGNAAAVPIGNVPVHTFGFGDGQDPKVLKAIADNSRMGGTYSDVHMDNLSLAFSQCLAGLLSVIAQNLTVIVTQIQDESSIKQVSTGNYPQSMDDAAGSVIIEFGDLYIQEVRKVLVDLHLPAIINNRGADIIEVSYTYKFDGKLFEANPLIVTVRRMSGLTAEEQQRLPEVRAEEVRLLISDVIKQATADADKWDLQSAQDKLVQGLKTLGDADIWQLKAELEELLELMKTQEIYEMEGRRFAYSLLVSLATQRQTARGNNMDKFQIFATPAMQEFLDEAKKLDDIDELQAQMDEMPAHQVQLSEAQKLIEQLRSERDYAKKQVEELRRLTELQSVGYFAQYSSSELQHATNNFHDSFKLGEGGYGIVYRGNLHNTTIAIKVLKEGSSQGEKEFHQEIEILSKVRHPNLVTLIGACAENRAVIYEYLPNGSLEDRLRCKNNTSPLLWQARIRIAFEICSALSFLHCSKPHGIVHGDLKPDNILLDSNNVSKISDFGLCRELEWTTGETMAYHLTYYPKGTLPYMDPEYLSAGRITPQSDVYAFGIMLLRLVTCQEPRGIRDAVEKARQTKGKLKTLIKTSGGGWPSEVAEKMISLGLRCSDPSRRNRPDLSTEVWQELKSIAEGAFASPSSWAASLIRRG